MCSQIKSFIKPCPKWVKPTFPDPVVGLITGKNKKVRIQVVRGVTQPRD